VGVRPAAPADPDHAAGDAGPSADAIARHGVRTGLNALIPTPTPSSITRSDDIQSPPGQMHHE
jgi:hypothetical protein